MNDHEIILAIQELMNQVEWDADTLEEIASLLDDNGYKVGDISDDEKETIND